MENNRHRGRKRRIEERRFWRYWCRWYQRHHRCGGFVLYGQFIEGYLAEVKQAGLADYLESQAQLLESFVPIPKFCNGLIGVSLTDTLPALANN